MKDGNGTSIKALFQGLIPEQGGVIQGKVMSTSPLVIQAVNDDKLRLTGSALIIPRHLTDYSATVSFTTGGEHHAANMTIYNHLTGGEMVYLLSLNYGKQYLVLDRVA